MENIKLNLKEIDTKNLNLKIYKTICEKVENKCYSEGFILKNSIDLINKSSINYNFHYFIFGKS
jgi:hypothetical protein